VEFSHDTDWKEPRQRSYTKYRDDVNDVPVISGVLDPDSGACLHPGSGMNFLRIPDPEGKIVGEIFLYYLKNPCSYTGLVLLASCD
jgi:hypothetical protein